MEIKRKRPKGLKVEADWEPELSSLRTACDHPLPQALIQTWQVYEVP